ncbi:uncharacterized protein LOC131309594 [Rhododendron vialii]|uniref:uncharacterized protein LOC131309594 n=1 Tax=Rhododendron vialii TaxID=182163 RepID=UPI00265EF00A|nr:uncharacterized protein LOC131309594 [Rhododendron vialii]
MDPEELGDQEILDLEKNFTQSQPDVVNKIQYPTKFPYSGVDRYYYPRPTPQDMLYGESGFQKQMSYSGRTIYEWNIDGMTEYQIFAVVHQMLMYSTICVNNDNDDQKVAGWITVGFIGMIKGWWDNVLTANQRSEILNAVKIKENGEQDVFLAKVMQRTDANSEHWKSKFVDGLPYFFAEKIRKKMIDQNNGLTINYDNYTYGQIIAIIIQEGLTLCNDIKLHNQLKKQNLTGKQEVGQFCDQFGYDMTQYPKPTKNKKKSSNKTTKQYSKIKTHKSKKTSKQSGSKKSTSDNNTKGRSQKKTTTKCFKCDKIGHYANKCKTKKKLNELQIDEGLKQQLFKLLLNSSDSESQDDSEGQINEVSDQDQGEDTSSTSEEQDSNNCRCNSVECSTSDNHWKAIVEMNGLSINVLTDKQQGILDINDEIDDPQLKIKIIETCISSNIEEEREQPLMPNKTYSL